MSIIIAFSAKPSICLKTNPAKSTNVLHSCTDIDASDRMIAERSMIHPSLTF